MSGLLDFLQSASNSAAGTVTAPVDGIAWLLRKAGIPVPNDPVGGSEWAKGKGLLRDVPQSGASVAGETVGLLSPMVAAAKAPQIAKGLLQAGENAAKPRALNPQTGAIVWHGSPHKFDKFDSSKIGTGEGAQAYGHGLYLAESPDVATQYQKTLSSRVKSANVGADVPVGDARGIAHEIATVHGGNVGEFIKSNRLHYSLEESRASSIGNSNRAKVLREIADENEEIAKQFIGKPVTAGLDGGALYKVDLPDPVIARMLDWDKPLSQQSGLVPKVFDNGWQHSLYRKRGGRDIGDFTGADLVNAFGSDSHSRALFADDLRRAGIPGIRYLDGGSRGAGSGTSNFVVFPGEESLLTILERNGIPLR